MEDQSKNISSEKSSQLFIITPEELAKLGILNTLTGQVKANNVEENRKDASVIPTCSTIFEQNIKKNTEELLKNMLNKQKVSRSDTIVLNKQIVSKNDNNILRKQKVSRSNKTILNKQKVSRSDYTIFKKPTQSTTFKDLKNFAKSTQTDKGNNNPKPGKINIISNKLLNSSSRELGKTLELNTSKSDHKKVNIISNTSVNIDEEELNKIVTQSSLSSTSKINHPKDTSVKIDKVELSKIVTQSSLSSTSKINYPKDTSVNIDKEELIKIVTQSSIPSTSKINHPKDTSVNIDKEDLIKIVTQSSIPSTSKINHPKDTSVNIDKEELIKIVTQSSTPSTSKINHPKDTSVNIDKEELNKIVTQSSLSDTSEINHPKNTSVNVDKEELNKILTQSSLSDTSQINHPKDTSVNIDKEKLNKIVTQSSLSDTSEINHPKNTSVNVDNEELNKIVTPSSLSDTSIIHHPKSKKSYFEPVESFLSSSKVTKSYSRKTPLNAESRSQNSNKDSQTAGGSNFVKAILKTDQSKANTNSESSKSGEFISEIKKSDETIVIEDDVEISGNDRYNKVDSCTNLEKLQGSQNSNIDKRKVRTLIPKKRGYPKSISEAVLIDEAADSEKIGVEQAKEKPVISFSYRNAGVSKHIVTIPKKRGRPQTISVTIIESERVGSGTEKIENIVGSFITNLPSKTKQSSLEEKQTVSNGNLKNSKQNMTPKKISSSEKSCETIIIEDNKMDQKGIEQELNRSRLQILSEVAVNEVSHSVSHSDSGLYNCLQDSSRQIHPDHTNSDFSVTETFSSLENKNHPQAKETELFQSIKIDSPTNKTTNNPYAGPYVNNFLPNASMPETEVLSEQRTLEHTEGNLNDEKKEIFKGKKPRSRIPWRNRPQNNEPILIKKQIIKQRQSKAEVPTLKESSIFEETVPSTSSTQSEILIPWGNSSQNNKSDTIEKNIDISVAEENKEIHNLKETVPTSSIAIETPIKSKRGRPIKKFTEAENSGPVLKKSKIEEQEATTPMHKSKRGRNYVKINYLDLLEKKYDSNDSGEDENSSTDISENPHKKKRGRPPKNKSYSKETNEHIIKLDTLNIQNIVNKVIDLTEPQGSLTPVLLLSEKSGGEITSKEKFLTKDDSSISVVSQPFLKKKRGRPRKNLLPDNIPHVSKEEIEINTPGNIDKTPGIELKEDPQCNLASELIAQKLANENSSKEECLTKESSFSEINESFDDTSASANIEEPIFKKKRGRPRKISQSIPHFSEEEIKVNASGTTDKKSEIDLKEVPQSNLTSESCSLNVVNENISEQKCVIKDSSISEINESFDDTYASANIEEPVFKMKRGEPRESSDNIPHFSEEEIEVNASGTTDKKSEIDLKEVPQNNLTSESSSLNVIYKNISEQKCVTKDSSISEINESFDDTRASANIEDPVFKMKRGEPRESSDNIPHFSEEEIEVNASGTTDKKSEIDLKEVPQSNLTSESSSLNVINENISEEKCVTNDSSISEIDESFDDTCASENIEEPIFKMKRGGSRESPDGIPHFYEEEIEVNASDTTDEKSEIDLKEVPQSNLTSESGSLNVINENISEKKCVTKGSSISEIDESFDGTHASENIEEPIFKKKRGRPRNISESITHFSEEENGVNASGTTDKKSEIDLKEVPQNNLTSESSSLSVINENISEQKCVPKDSSISEMNESFDETCASENNDEPIFKNKRNRPRKISESIQHFSEEEIKVNASGTTDKNSQIHLKEGPQSNLASESISPKLIDENSSKEECLTKDSSFSEINKSFACASAKNEEPIFKKKRGRPRKSLINSSIPRFPVEEIEVNTSGTTDNKPQIDLKEEPQSKLASESSSLNNENISEQKCLIKDSSISEINKSFDDACTSAKNEEPIFKKKRGRPRKISDNIPHFSEEEIEVNASGTTDKKSEIDLIEVPQSNLTSESNSINVINENISEQKCLTKDSSISEINKSFDDACESAKNEEPIFKKKRGRPRKSLRNSTISHFPEEEIEVNTSGTTDKKPQIDLKEVPQSKLASESSSLNNENISEQKCLTKDSSISEINEPLDDTSASENVLQPFLKKKRGRPRKSLIPDSIPHFSKEQFEVNTSSNKKPDIDLKEVFRQKRLTKDSPKIDKSLVDVCETVNISEAILKQKVGKPKKKSNKEDPQSSLISESVSPNVINNNNSIEKCLTKDSSCSEINKSTDSSAKTCANTSRFCKDEFESNTSVPSTSTENKEDDGSKHIIFSSQPLEETREQNENLTEESEKGIEQVGVTSSFETSTPVNKRTGRPKKQHLNQEYVPKKEQTVLLPIIDKKREQKINYELEDTNADEIRPPKKRKRKSSDDELYKTITVKKETTSEKSLENSEEPYEVGKRKNVFTGKYSKMVSEVFSEALKSNSSEDSTPVKKLISIKKGRPKKNSFEFFVNEKGHVICVPCQEEIEFDDWNVHNKTKHNNLAWREGEPVVNLDHPLVKSKLKPLVMKNKSITCLKCEKKCFKTQEFILHTEECLGIVINGNVTCAVCNDTMSRDSWVAHRIKHNTLAWRVGEYALDINDETFVLQILNSLYKAKKPLHCYKCDSIKKSVIGLLSHFGQCGKEESKIACELCGKKVLPVSLVSHMKIHENPKIGKTATSTYFDVDLDSSQHKRKAASKALAILDEISSDKSEIYRQHFFNQINFMEDNTLLKFLNAELESNNTIKCKIGGCEFCCEETSMMITHLSTCPLKPDMYYTCKTCFSTVPSIDKISEHLKSVHNINVRMEEDYFGNLEDDDSDEDNESFFSNARRKRKSRKSDQISRTGNDQINFRVKPSFIFRALNTRKETDILFSQAFNFTIEFAEENFGHKLVFKDLIGQQKDWNLVDVDLLEKYFPLEDLSCDVSVQSLKDLENIYIQEHTFKKYELFEVEKEKDSITIFCGGPILCQAWMPTPHTSLNEDQILAVATGKDFDGKYNHNEQYSESTLIQFWNFGLLKNCDTWSEPKLEFCLGMDDGPIWDLVWCPSGCYNVDELSSEWCRRGLLAVAGCLGNVDIYSIPFLKDDQKIGLCFKTSPVLRLQLTLDANDLKRRTFSTKISWSKISGHKHIAVGYSDGTVALYNLDYTSNLLLQKNEPSPDVLLPYKILKSHSHFISALSLVPIQEGNVFLLTGSFDKVVNVWDLRNDTKYTLRKGRCVTDGTWLTHWLSFVCGHDESTATLGQVLAISNSHREYLYDMAQLSFSISGITTISSSDWLNSFVLGNQSGETNIFIPHQILFETPKGKKMTQFRFVTGYTKLIDKTLPPEERDALENEKNAVLKYETCKNLQKCGRKYTWHEPFNYEAATKKYGVIFCNTILSQMTPDVTNSDYFKPNLYPLQAINKVSFNPNRQSSLYYVTGHQVGFLRLSYLKCLEKDKQILQSQMYKQKNI